MKKKTSKRNAEETIAARITENSAELEEVQEQMDVPKPTEHNKAAHPMSIFDEDNDDGEGDDDALMSEMSASEIANQEIVMFRKNPKIGLRENPLSKLQEYKDAMPNLMKLALRYAVAQATSVSSESE